MTGASILGTLGAVSKAKSKSTTPQINVSDSDQLDAIAAILDAKAEKKRAESALDIAEEAYRDTAGELFEKRCRDDGRLHTSVKLMGILNPDEEGRRPLSIRFEQRRCCKKMREDTETTEALAAAFGDDYGDLFEAQRVVAIDTSVLTDKQIGAVVKAVQKALGFDKDSGTFEAAVSVESLIQPREVFFTKRILDAEIRVKADNAVADGYAIPYTPSFKA